jgi:hypothetical protein
MSNPAWLLLQVDKCSLLFEHHEATFGQYLTESRFEIQTCVNLIPQAQGPKLIYVRYRVLYASDFKCNPNSFSENEIHDVLECRADSVAVAASSRSVCNADIYNPLSCSDDSCCSGSCTSGSIVGAKIILRVPDQC